MKFMSDKKFDKLYSEYLMSKAKKAAKKTLSEEEINHFLHAMDAKGEFGPGVAI